MADVKWIKITTTMFEDEKIDFIESLPESDAILIIWIKLLAQAGKTNSNGFIFLTEQIPYTDEMLSHKFRRSLNVVKLALQTLKQLEMIEYDDSGFLRISNWEKHQNIIGLEKIREQTRKRVAKHRENQKGLTSNVTVTQSNETDIDIDIDIDIDKEIDKDKDKPKKTAYGEFSKVKLLEEEYNKLLERLGEIVAKDLISRLDNYKESTGKTYKSDYATILNWSKREATNGGDRARTNNTNAKATEQGEDIAKRANVISL